MPDHDDSFRELERRFSRWLRRLRLRDALIWAPRGLAAGLALALGISFGSWLFPFATVPTLVALSVGFALGGLEVAAAIAYFWPHQRLESARYFDRLFGLSERTSTAFELALQPSAAPEWLRRDQWADAAAAARRVDPARRLRNSLDWREALLLVGFSGILALTLYLPNPQEQRLATAGEPSSHRRADHRH